MADIPVKTNGYAHFVIIDHVPTSIDDVPEVLFGGTIDHAIKLTDADGVSYYVGYKWDGIMLYKVEETRSYSYDEVTLDLIDGEVHHVVIS